MFNSYVRLPEGHKGDGVEGWEIPPPKNHSHGIKPMTSVFIDAKPCDPSNHREINWLYGIIRIIIISSSSSRRNIIIIIIISSSSMYVM